MHSSHALLSCIALLSALCRTAWGAALTGPERSSSSTRPDWAHSHPALCSERLPLCVHADSRALVPLLAPTLAELETAARTVRDVLHWPAPLPDAAGGSSAFDVYLDASLAEPYRVVPEPSWRFDFIDRAPAFAVVQPASATGCRLRAVLAEVYARAGLLGLDAAANSATATATSAYVAMQATGCVAQLFDAVDDYQANPSVAVSNPAFARGTVVFPWFVQSQLGAGASVDLLHAVFALSTQRTAQTEPRWNNEPDVFDTLDAVLRNRNQSLDELLLDYTVARAFMGSRDDGLHLADSRVLSHAGDVQFLWRVDYESLPRSLASTPVEPTGATFIWIDTRRAPPQASLTVSAQWETPTVFRFALVRVDAQGAELSRIKPPSPQRDTQVQATIERLDGAAGVLVAAVNVGSKIESFAFDPDMTPYMPNAFAITLYGQ